MEGNSDLLNELEFIAKKLEAENLSFEDKLNLKDREHNIKMKLNGVKPMDSSYDCFGCGA